MHERSKYRKHARQMSVSGQMIVVHPRQIALLATRQRTIHWHTFESFWSGMSRFPGEEKSGRVRIRGSLRRIIYDRSRNRELSRDVSSCAQPR